MDEPTADRFREAFRRLADHDPGAFCRLVYAIADDLKGSQFGKAPGPYSSAAREAGYAFSDAALRYGREADAIDERRAEDEQAAA